MPPPDEVRNAILVVLCLNGLATSIGFCVNRIPHNNKLNYQSHSESHSPLCSSLYRDKTVLSVGHNAEFALMQLAICPPDLGLQMKPVPFAS